jgi:Ca2+/Na+ antiporter
MTLFLIGLFVMAAACYLLFITSDPLEQVGGRLGRLLHLPEDVIASTFQALATSGPEIVMAILAATAYITAESQWDVLTTGERGCSGCLNMCFSAMDNLLGIGCVGMIFMMWKKYIKGDEVVVVAPSVTAGLIFYTISSACLCAFVQISSFSKVVEGREIVAHVMTVWQAWVLMGIGIAFVLSQFFLPTYLARRHAKRVAAGLETEIPEDDDEEEEEEEEAPIPQKPLPWLRDLVTNGFIYAFLVYALVIFVRECLAATFDMATVGIVSVGGVLIMFTSYVSSFPEFMMTYRYAAANKKNALLGMLFGSNVIDLAFAGFRAIKLGEPMEIYTMGKMQHLFPVYLWCLPLLAVVTLIALSKGWFKYKHAYVLVVLYLTYIISGFILL